MGIFRSSILNLKFPLLLVLLAFASFAASSLAGTVTWDGGGDGMSWHDPLNWNTDTLPTDADAVVINVASNVTIIHSTGNTVVQSIQCNGNLQLAGGSITATEGASSLGGPFGMATGTRLTATGANTSLTATNNVQADGASLVVSGGASLRLEGLRNFQSGPDVNTEFRAEGPGSVLALPGLTNAVGGSHDWWWYRWFVTAVNGGRVEMGSLQTIPGGLVVVNAADTNSTVDLSGLTYVAGMWQMSLTVGSGSAVLLGPQLTALEPVVLNVAGGGTLDLSHITHLRSSSVSLSAGAWLDLTNLVAADASSFSVSGGVRLVLPGLRSYQSGADANQEFRADGPGSVLALPGLTNAVGGSHDWWWYRWFVTAVNGGRVEMGSLQTIPDGLVTVNATHTNSTVDWSGLQSVAGIWQMSLTVGSGSAVLLGSQLTALEPVVLNVAGGGTLDLSRITHLRSSSVSLSSGAWLDLTNLVAADASSFSVSSGVRLVLPGLRSYQSGADANQEFRADGPGSVLALPGLTNAVGGSHQWGWWRWTITAVNGGRVEMGSLQTIPGGLVTVNTANTNSTVDLSGLASVAGIGQIGLTVGSGSAVLMGPQLTVLELVVLALAPGGTLDLSHVTTMRKSSISLGTGAWVDTSRVTDLQESSVNLQDGAWLDLTNVVAADGASFRVSGGSQLVLPGVRNYQAGASADTEFRADGTGSLLALPGLTNAVGGTHQWNWYRWFVTAVNGGRVELGALRTISGGMVTCASTGTNSVVDWSGLESTAGMGSLSLAVGSGGTVFLGPQLTALEPVTLTVASGGMLDLSHVTSMNASAVSLTEPVTLNLTNLAQVDQSSFRVSGGAQLVLPGVRNYQAGASANTEFRADGSGSLLSLPGLTNAVGGTHQWGWYRWLVNAINGGRVELGALRTIPGGQVNMLADGTNSVLALTDLTRLAGPGSALEARNGGWLGLNSSTSRLEQATLLVRAGSTIEAGTVELVSSLLSGDGTVAASLVNAGQVRPSGSSSGLTVVGPYLQTASGNLYLESLGTSQADGFCPLVLRSNATLGGTVTLDVAFPNRLGDCFVIVSNQGPNAITGTFADLPQGRESGVGPQTFVMFYTGGDGNDAMVMRPLLTLTREAAGQIRVDAVAHDFFAQYPTTLSPGCLRLDGVGERNRLHHLEASTNLTTWEIRTTLTSNADGLLQHLVTDAAEMPCLFFRVRQP